MEKVIEVLISFVIPAHDEEGELPATLEAMRRAIGEVMAVDASARFEIVVADDASSDRTGEIARAAGATVVRHERRQISATRNLGARAATGEMLMFVDADTRVNAASVREAIEIIRGGAVGGGAPLRFEGQVPLWTRMTMPFFNWLFRVLRLTGGAFLFCRKGALDEAGGWDETLFASEEIRLAGALKKTGRFEIVKTPVDSSGRKVRTHSGWEFLWLFARSLVRPSVLERREGLDVWYGKRREDPKGGAQS